VVLALASGARPPAVEHAPRRTPVLSLPGGEAALTDTHLFVHRPDRPVNDGGSVTAYRLPDGVQVWRREVPTAVAVPVVAGVPLVVSVELADLAPGAAGAGGPPGPSPAPDPAHGPPPWPPRG